MFKKRHWTLRVSIKFNWNVVLWCTFKLLGEMNDVGVIKLVFQVTDLLSLSSSGYVFSFHIIIFFMEHILSAICLILVMHFKCNIQETSRRTTVCFFSAANKCYRISCRKLKQKVECVCPPYSLFHRYDASVQVKVSRLKVAHVLWFSPNQRLSFWVIRTTPV